jgi:hypothetical protein
MHTQTDHVPSQWREGDTVELTVSALPTEVEFTIEWQGQARSCRMPPETRRWEVLTAAHEEFGISPSQAVRLTAWQRGEANGPTQIDPEPLKEAYYILEEFDQTTA